MGIINNNTQLYGWLKDLSVYSSNFAELKSSKDSESKVKYRVSEWRLNSFDYLVLLKILQPAKADIFMTMDNESQKIDLRISEIIVSIAPAAIRTIIGVTSSLGTLQVNQKNQEIWLIIGFVCRMWRRMNWKKSIRHHYSIQNLLKMRSFGLPKVRLNFLLELNELFDWIDFLQEIEDKDILETVRGTPSQQKPIKEEENKIKAKEEEVPKPMVQRVWN